MVFGCFRPKQAARTRHKLHRDKTQEVPADAQVGKEEALYLDRLSTDKGTRQLLKKKDKAWITFETISPVRRHRRSDRLCRASLKPKSSMGRLETPPKRLSSSASAPPNTPLQEPPRQSLSDAPPQKQDASIISQPPDWRSNSAYNLVEPCRKSGEPQPEGWEKHRWMQDIEDAIEKGQVALARVKTLMERPPKPAPRDDTWPKMQRTHSTSESLNGMPARKGGLLGTIDEGVEMSRQDVKRSGAPIPWTKKRLSFGYAPGGVSWEEWLEGGCQPRTEGTGKREGGQSEASRWTPRRELGRVLKARSEFGARSSKSWLEGPSGAAWESAVEKEEGCEMERGSRVDDGWGPPIVLQQNWEQGGVAVFHVDWSKEGRAAREERKRSAREGGAQKALREVLEAPLTPPRVITADELKLDVRLPPIRTSPKKRGSTPRAPAPTPDSNASFASSKSSWQVSTEHRPVEAPEQRGSWPAPALKAESTGGAKEERSGRTLGAEKRGPSLEALEFILAGVTSECLGDNTEQLTRLAIACGTPPAVLTPGHSFKHPAPIGASPSTPLEEDSVDTWQLGDSRFSAAPPVSGADKITASEVVPSKIHRPEPLPRFDEFRRRKELAVGGKGETDSISEAHQELPVQVSSAIPSNARKSESRSGIFPERFLSYFPAADALAAASRAAAASADLSDNAYGDPRSESYAARIERAQTQKLLALEQFLQTEDAPPAERTPSKAPEPDLELGISALEEGRKRLERRKSLDSAYALKKLTSADVQHSPDSTLQRRLSPSSSEGPSEEEGSPDVSPTDVLLSGGWRPRHMGGCEGSQVSY